MKVLLLILTAAPLIAGPPDDWRTKLVAGQRIEVEHGGKLDRGIYALSNLNEIVITTSRNGFLSILQSEVDRVILKGTDSPKLGYFKNAGDQLFPKPEVIYDRKHQW
jgi:hypothetical protein